MAEPTGMELTSAHIVPAMDAFIRSDVGRLRELGVTPHLFMGTDNYFPQNQLYMDKKERAAVDLGIQADAWTLPSAGGLLRRVQRAGEDPSINGIIVQLPLEDPDTTEE